jgi:formylglycine-generating enzyme required for sulfatase activity
MRPLFTGIVLALMTAGLHEAVAADTFRDCADCPEMIAVSPGAFRMGALQDEHDREQSPERYPAWESPVRTVRVDRPFAVGITEVTRAQFEAFATATGTAITGCDIAKGDAWEQRADKSWRDPGFAQDATHPVVCVNWHDAQAYVAWLRTKTGKPYRLLTEAEWEYVARAGTQAARFWGDGRDGACTYANVPDQSHAQATQTTTATFDCSDGYAFTSPVQSFRPNGFGLFDTLGNVWEWVEDCFHDSYSGAADTAVSRQSDASCQYHSARGGSWNPRLLTQIRSAARGRVTTSLRNSNLGLRVALDLAP